MAPAVPAWAAGAQLPNAEAPVAAPTGEAGGPSDEAAAPSGVVDSKAPAGESTDAAEVSPGADSGEGAEEGTPSGTTEGGSGTSESVKTPTASGGDRAEEGGGLGAGLLEAVDPSVQATTGSPAATDSSLGEATDATLSPEDRAEIIDQLVAVSPHVKRAHLESLSDEELSHLIMLMGNLLPVFEVSNASEQLDLLLSDDWADLIDLLFGPDVTDELFAALDAVTETGDTEPVRAWLVTYLGGSGNELDALVAEILAALGPGAPSPSATPTPSTSAPVKDVVATKPAPHTTVSAQAGEKLAATGANSWGPAGLGLAAAAAGVAVLGLRRIRLGSGARKH